jgi:pyruvate/2-oxoglutarate dehydrogenase complex dihydrolipoamide acyltransferase (E2) component
VLPLLMVSALVFLALGGTAFAAGSLARNSVGSAQIKAKAVRASELHADAVSSGTIRNGAVTGSDVATGTLGGREVADGSLTGADLADGSVVGDDLADASIGGRKLAGNSIGMQAIEPLTQKSLVDVPTTQVLPTRGSDLGLTLNLQSLQQLKVTPEQAGVNILQAQVSVKTTKAISVTCEIAVDGVPATRVRQTIAKSTLTADYTAISLMTTASVKVNSVVATRCEVGEAFVATALLTSSATNDWTNPTTMIATRVAR